MEFLSTIDWAKVWQIASAVIVAAGAIVAVTPTPNDDKWYAQLRKVLNLVGLNVGGARNANEIDPLTGRKPDQP